MQIRVQDVAITSSGLGLTDVGYKRDIDIVQQDRDGTALRRWSLSRAWPVKLRPACGSAVLRTRFARAPFAHFVRKP